MSHSKVVCVTHGLFMDRLIKALAGLDPHLGDMLIMTFNCAYWLVQLRLDHDEKTPRKRQCLALQFTATSGRSRWDQATIAFRTGYEVANRFLGEGHALTITLLNNSNAVLKKSKDLQDGLQGL
eukprot:g18181.t1